jgi:hypothetical protein
MGALSLTLADLVGAGESVWRNWPRRVPLRGGQYDRLPAFAADLVRRQDITATGDTAFPLEITVTVHPIGLCRSV